jgi:multisubunit Na+/H+ antiporter MnhB subunit
VVSVVLELIAPRLLGPALMVAIAIIVKGYGDVGDGFSAGVIVATAIALRYVVLGPERTERGLPILRHAPVIAVVGLLIALGRSRSPAPFDGLERAIGKGRGQDDQHDSDAPGTREQGGS